MSANGLPENSLPADDRAVKAPRRLNIAVIGLGVVGGSLARALQGTRHNLAGWDADPRQCDKAAASGIVVASTLHNAVRYADVVFCCAPVSVVGEIARGSATHMSAGGLVVDVGSTKTQPVRDMRAACRVVGRDDLVVIGTHPMAGSEKSGFDHSDPALFAGCTWVLTPERESADAKTQAWLETLTGLLRDLGARTVPVMEPEVHDRTVAACSHLIQAAATCVAGTVAAAALNDPTLPIFDLAAGGFRDSTRVADSSSTMWLPILQGNATNTVPLLRDLAARVLALAEAVESGETSTIESAFRDGQEARANWRAAQERRQ